MGNYFALHQFCFDGITFYYGKNISIFQLILPINTSSKDFDKTTKIKHR